MITNEIVEYVRSELAKGTVSENDLRATLSNSGWKAEDIDQAVHAATQPVQKSALPEVTEKDYPITTLWVFKAPLVMFFFLVIALLFGYWIPYFVIAIPILLIANPLIRRNFHYLVGDRFFIVKQGVFSKKERSLPYGVIQNVFVKQDLFNRIFSLATLRVENASQGNAKANRSFRLTDSGSSRNETVGASGNKVNIPGLKKKDAEALKMLILQKIKENPIDSLQSGL